MSDVHVDSDLSAYLDGELAALERDRVDLHLGACERCRARLTDLRATASLVAALPMPRPSRSLVPVLRERFNWLRPIRSLSAVASGGFLFLFLVTAVARSGGGLGGAASAPAFGASGNTTTATSAPVPAAAPLATAGPFFAPAQPAPTAAGQRAAQATPTSAADAAAERTGASPSVFVFVIDHEPVNPFADPRLWLVLAIVAALAAIVAHWRVRTT